MAKRLVPGGSPSADAAKARYAAACECLEGVVDELTLKRKARKKGSGRKPSPWSRLEEQYRGRMVRNGFVIASTSRIEIVGPSPFRTGLHFFNEEGFDPVQLWLHRTGDMGTGGLPYAQLAPGGSITIECGCMLRAIQSEWCVIVAPSGTIGFSFVHFHEVMGRE